MMSQLSAGLGAAILGLASGVAHAQGCVGPVPCPGGYAPASPAYVFQPGPTAAYQAYGQGYGYAPGAAEYPGYAPAPPMAPGYDRYGGEYAHGYQARPAPYGYQGGYQGAQQGGYQGLPPAPYAQQPYGYVPAYGRGVYADRPYAGPGPGYDARGCGAPCAPPVQPYQPAYQPCASPCGYPAPQAYAPQVEAPQVEAPAPVAGVSVGDGFLYGLSGGSGGYPEGGGGGGINPQGFGFDNGFGLSAVNNFYGGFSSANAFANSAAAARVNVNVNNQAYANANAEAEAMANAKAVNKNHAMPVYMPKPQGYGGGVGYGMAAKHGCCVRRVGGHH